MAHSVRTNASTTRALDLVERLSAISTLISSLELWARPRLYDDANLMSWQVSQLRSPRLLRGPLGRVLARLLAYPMFRALLMFRAIGSFGLVMGRVSGRRARTVKTSMALSVFPVTLRSPYGWDGADQMAAITALALAGRSWLPEIEPTVQRFFAFQLCLCYFASGVAKATSPEWRSGSALTGISSTEMYGDPSFYRWLQGSHPRARLIARGVLVAGCAFPLILVVPSRVRQTVLVGGVFSHAVVAKVMGLNTFFWSFVSVYPALENYCRSREAEIEKRRG
jgi:hypothetical protein